MTVGRHYGPAVRALAARLQTYLPSYLASVATAQAVRLDLPVDYTTARRESAVAFGGAQQGRLPKVFVAVEGSVRPEEWVTPQRDLVVPLLVRLVYREARRQGEIERIGDAYAEALERCLDVYAVDWPTTGVWWWGFEDSIVQPHGSDPWRRQVDVRGTIKVRTSRSG